MTTIYIDYSISANTIETIESALDRVAQTDPQWNGANFQIKRYEYTSIDCEDESLGTILLHSIIYPIIDRASRA